MTNTLITIYDFAILPYALGDVLTWSVKKQVKAKDNNLDKIVTFICADEKTPSFIHQNQYITPDNFEISLLELMPAFWVNPMVEEIRVFKTRASLLNELSLHKNKNLPSQTEIINYCQTWEKRNIRGIVDHFVFQQVSSHNDINVYAKNHNNIPWLKVPKSFKKNILEDKKRWGENQYFIGLNFRSRANDPDSNNAELARDVDTNTWQEFINKAGIQRPDVTFVMLGKIQEKPDTFFQMDNVLIPRIFGQNLGHELAWIAHADCFIGSSSGFAAMANFTKTPYLITGMNPLAREFYGISMADNCLPFAQNNQQLINQESVEQLLTYLNETLPKRDHKKSNKNKVPSINHIPSIQGKSKKQIVPFADILEEYNHFLEQGLYNAAFGVLDVKLRKAVQTTQEKLFYLKLRVHYLLDTRLFSQAKSEVIKLIGQFPHNDEGKKLLEKINSHLLLENVNRFSQRNPDVEESYCGANLVRAQAYLNLEYFDEALTSINHHLQYFQSDDSALLIKKQIEEAIKTYLNSHNLDGKV